jgi:uncharacterized protein (DUF1499 family)
MKTGLWRRIGKVALVIVLVAVASPIWLVPALDTLGLGQEEIVKDLRDVRLSAWKQNEYLVLPEGFAGTAPHRPAPVFDKPAAAVAAALERIVRASPRTEMTGRTDDGLKFEAVQRSPYFHFPDRITMEVVPLDAERATLAVYSRSRYGRRDFGVNAKRVEAWLAALERELR